MELTIIIWLAKGLGSAVRLVMDRTSAVMAIIAPTAMRAMPRAGVMRVLGCFLVGGDLASAVRVGNYSVPFCLVSHGVEGFADRSPGDDANSKAKGGGGYG